MEQDKNHSVKAVAMLVTCFLSLSAAAQVAPTFSGSVNPGALSITANPATPSGSVPTAFTVALQASDSTGIVALLDGHELIGWGTLVNGVSTVILPAEKVPSHTVVAIYSGDKHYAAVSTSSNTSNSSDQITFGTNGVPAITVSTVPTPGHEKEFATYTVKFPDATATGLVLFVLNGAVVGSGTIEGGTVTLTRGIGTMHIIYTGDDKHAPVSL